MRDKSRQWLKAKYVEFRISAYFNIMITDDLYRRAQKAEKKWRHQLKLKKHKEREQKALSKNSLNKTVSQKWEEYLNKRFNDTDL